MLVHRLGRGDPAELLGQFTPQQVKTHFIRDMELLSQRKAEISQELGRPVYKHW